MDFVTPPDATSILPSQKLNYAVVKNFAVVKTYYAVANKVSQKQFILVVFYRSTKKNF